MNSFKRLKTGDVPCIGTRPALQENGKKTLLDLPSEGFSMFIYDNDARKKQEIRTTITHVRRTWAIVVRKSQTRERAINSNRKDTRVRRGNNRSR